MAAYPRFSLRCRCGKKLKVDEEKILKEKLVVIFCADCYLNHRVEMKGDNPKVTLQYYFPDD